ncbi:HAD family hydrolase [Pokkaliibacter plantistimulans]|nr:HAD-IA family hydrolase [Pokkaliibacter plantistimulans]
MAVVEMASGLAQYRSWIFDLDGTLICNPLDFVGMREALGIAAGVDILAYVGSLDEAQQREAEAIVTAFEVRAAEQSTVMPGAREVLVKLQEKHAQGYRVGVLSRNHRQAVLAGLHHSELLSFFAEDCILAREDAAAKPDPAGIHKLLSFWQASTSTAVMVGDFHYDLSAGRAAGVATLLVGRESLWPALTDHHYVDWSDVLSAL